jgi:hypothetical protein
MGRENGRTPATLMLSSSLGAQYAAHAADTVWYIFRMVEPNGHAKMSHSVANTRSPARACVPPGVFHGVNPAMGWLFAVALGLNRRNRPIVLLLLVPIALGHAAAIVLVVAAILVLGQVVN